MLHTKFQCHQPFSPEKNIFKGVFTLYGHVGHLDHVTQILCTNFHSPIPERHHMKFGFNQTRSFREVKNTESLASRTKDSK